MRIGGWGTMERKRTLEGSDREFDTHCWVPVDFLNDDPAAAYGGSVGEVEEVVERLSQRRAEHL